MRLARRREAELPGTAGRARAAADRRHARALLPGDCAARAVRRSPGAPAGVRVSLRRASARAARRAASADELGDALETRSGLLGVSGVSSDLREVLAAADAGSPRAKLAFELFVHTLRRAVGAMLAVLGGLDVLVFTGDIGENSARVRDAVSASVAFAGAVRALVIPAREDLVILDEVLRLHPVR
ncbi:MAG TPA: hypothetical protein VLT45_24865 [Kofleriaceae bacterium]|nr:hypothetical protein [Kofleriaceae bacterium]